METSPSAPVAGTRSTKGSRTRRRVLDAAASLFAQQGLATVSMSDVATAAGMKAGSLYFHFSSKDVLIDEVLGVGIGHTFAHVDRAVSVQDSLGTSPTERLRKAIEAHLVALHDLSDYASVVAQGTADRSQRNGNPYLPLERRYAGFWIQLLTDAQKAGVVPADLDVRLVRDLLFGAMNASTMRSRRPEDVARTLAALIGSPGD